jgi:tellurite methyltransferase
MDWNTRYLAGDFNDSPASQLLIDAAKPLIPRRALDVACGAGRNALELARRGWAVTAIDAASEGIAILERRAGEAGVKIDARVMDLEREPLPFEEETFDVIAVFFYLQRSLMPELQKLTAPGGVFVAAIHTVDDAEGLRPMNPSFLLAPGELSEMFGDWEILLDRESAMPGSRSIAEIIARRRAT